MIGATPNPSATNGSSRWRGFYEVEAQADAFLSHELIGLLVRFTHLLGKEILSLPSPGRRGGGRDGKAGPIGWTCRIYACAGDRTLSGVRCVHSHPGGDARLSSVDLQALQRMRFDAMASVGVSDEDSPQASGRHPGRRARARPVRASAVGARTGLACLTPSCSRPSSGRTPTCARLPAPPRSKSPTRSGCS